MKMETQQIPVVTTKPFEMFLDLDGVFADFNRKIKELSGLWPHELPSTNRLWKIVYSTPNFFYKLDLMQDAEHLWSYVKQYQPTFLTGAPSSNVAREDKKRWVAEKFGEEWNVIVLPRKEKQLYSGPNKILIDDNTTLIEQWIAKGGLGVLHSGDVWGTIATVESLRKAYE